MTIWKQCKFQHGNAFTVAWIDERGAIVGKDVELVTADGKFWRVVEVYEPGMDESVLRAKQKMDRNALPSIVGQKGG